MPAAKVNYRKLTEGVVVRLDTELHKTGAHINEVMAWARANGFKDASKSRVLLWFRKGRVAGWTANSNYVMKVEGAVSLQPAEPSKPKEPEQPKIPVRKPEFGSDVKQFVPAAIPAIAYYERRIGGGMTDVTALTLAWQNRSNVVLVGKPGTGKSTVPWVVAQKLGLPVVRISMEETKDASKILGGPTADRDGKLRFIEAPALTLFRQGGLLVIEELNAVTPGVAFAMHPMLDDRGVLVVDELGEVVQRHPDFWCIATMNPSEDQGAAGTQQVNYALWDRFPCKLFYDYDRDIEAKLVHDDERILKIRDKLRASDLRTETTTRMLRDLYRNTGVFGWAVAKTMFVANYPSSEREVVSETCKLIGG